MREELDIPEPVPLALRQVGLIWIIQAILPAPRKWTHITRYGLKHVLERDLNLYLTNGQFKKLMLAAGHKPTSTLEQNWRFKIRPAKRGKIFTMILTAEDEIFRDYLRKRARTARLP